MKWLECPCEVDNCVFRKMPEHETHSRIMHQLLDTRVYLQIKSDHWLFVEIVAKYLEENEIEYSSSEALGQSIRRWAKRHGVHIFENHETFCEIKVAFVKDSKKNNLPITILAFRYKSKIFNHTILSFFISQKMLSIIGVFCGSTTCLPKILSTRTRCEFSIMGIFMTVTVDM